MIMDSRTAQLVKQIDAAHEYRDGQIWGHGGTSMATTNKCPICGLHRHWSIDRQNGNDGRVEYTDENGDDLTLAAALARGCA